VAVTRKERPEGAPVDALLDTIEHSLAEGLLPVEIFNDPRIHQLELERIYLRCWVFVGHVSEIPEPGDYVLRYVGEDQFILVRDEEDGIRLLLNSCRHRGSPVCRAEKGNASHFRCPYHMWVYKNTGEWKGAPHRRRAYRELDASQWGLLAAPKLETIHGLVFASLDPAAPTLREYLGDMAWYLDALFGVDPQGTSVVGEPHRWRIAANWKSAAENFLADAYHVPSLHRSAEEIGVLPNIDAAIGRQIHLDIGNGHGLILNPGFLPRPPWSTLDVPEEVAQHFRFDSMSPEQAEFIQNWGVTTFTIFPNLSFICAPGSTDPERVMPSIFMALRQWQPRGPDGLEIWNWPLAWNSAPDEFKAASYTVAVNQFSPSGIFEQDDTVVWAGAPVVGASTFARRNAMQFNYQLGHDGMSDYGYREDWIGPGKASTSIYGELPQRSYYARWLQEMTRP
jgi:phenylpropionate dioxygenase-like ring-hydroxylating dioxygenase large terminal subunit